MFIFTENKLFIVVLFPSILIFRYLFLNVVYLQEPVELLEMNHVLNLEQDGKLHVLFGGTKVVQNTPPSKFGPVSKGRHCFL